MLKWKDEAESNSNTLRWKDEAETPASPATTSMADFRTLDQKSSKQPAPSTSKLETVKHIGESAGLGLFKGGAQVGALAQDLMMGPYDILVNKQPAFYRSRNFENTWDTAADPLKEKLGLKDTTGENIAEGLTSLIPSIGISGGITKLSGIAPLVEDAAAAVTKKMGGNLAAKAAGYAIKDTPDMLNTWLMTEAPKPAEERTPLYQWAPEWVGGDLALKGITKGIGAGIRSIKGKTPEISPENIIQNEPTTVPEAVKEPIVKVNPGNLKWIDENIGADITRPNKGEELINGQKVRSLGVTGVDAEFTSPEVKQGLIDEMVPGGRGAYDPITNADTLEQARQLIEQDADAVTRRILSNEPSTATDNAAGMLLIQRAQDAGDYSKAVDLVESLATKATEQGRAIQALSMWSRLTPEGMLRYGQKVIDQANAQNKRMGGSTNRFKMSPEIAEKVTTYMKQAEGLEGRAKDIKVAQALDLIAGQVHPSILRKVSTLQTMAQLLNPKTGIRNIVGNMGFQGLENVSDVVGTGIDAATSLFTSNRTKVLPSLITQGKGMIKGAKLGLEDALLGVDTSNMAGGKFDLPTTRTFRSGPLGAAEKAMNVELRASDRAFYQAAFDESLRQQVAAAAKSGKAVTEATDAMQEIAHHDALYRTFQDSNALSNAFTGIKRALNGGKEFGLGDFVLKYPKTPANLLARGIEYSPAGLVKTVMEASKPLMGKEFNQKVFVESLSRAVTGTATGVGTGAALHRLGLITGGPDDDRDVSALEQQTGFGQYRLNVSGLKRFVTSGFNPEEAKIKPGDITVSYDWFQPWAIPLAIGADIDANKGQAKGISGTLVNAFTTGVNAFAEQPVMTGLQTVFGQREPAEAIPAVLKGIPASFVPTLLNQIKQFTDNQKRNTYDPNFTTEMMNRAQTRIPGLGIQLPQNYGTLGQPLTTYQNSNGLTGNNAFNVFFNPAFVNKYAPTPEAQMVIDIYKNTGETSQVPRVIAKYFNIGGKKIDLTAEEYSAMQKQVGELTQQGFSRIPTDLSGEEKLKAMGSVMTDAGQEARIAVMENRRIPLPESWTQGTGYLIRAINQGDTQKARSYVLKNASNNAFEIYDYGKKHGMVDESGNPDGHLTKALSEAWEAQTASQSKSAAYGFLKDACESNSEEHAVKWAGIAKQSGLTVKQAETRIRQAARPTTPGAKTPTIDQVLQGGYDVDPTTVRKILWAMNQ